MDKPLDDATDDYVNRLASDEALLSAEDVARRAKEKANRTLDIVNAEKTKVFFDNVSSRVTRLNARLNGKITITKVGEGGRGTAIFLSLKV